MKEDEIISALLENNKMSEKLERVLMDYIRERQKLLKEEIALTKQQTLALQIENGSGSAYR
jgi:hypothetical protein